MLLCHFHGYMLSASCGKTDGNSLGKPHASEKTRRGKKETKAAVEKPRVIVIRSNGNGPGNQDAVRLALVSVESFGAKKAAAV